MQEYVYVHPFGKYLPGDHVELDVPEGTPLVNALAVDDPRLGTLVVDPTPEEAHLGNETKPEDEAEAARQAAIAEAEKNLAAATAAEDEAHPDSA
jgi:hypothetical protein